MSYDIIVAPLLHFFIDYHNGLIDIVDREKSRIKALEDHSKLKTGEVKEVDVLSAFQKLVYKTFSVENMYLLK
jgi:hypothetical protein